MRQFDLAPLYRSTVGFDRLFSALDQFVSADAVPTYPPYNIERTGENAYRITVAVAGFTEADLTIEVKETLSRSRVSASRMPAERSRFCIRASPLVASSVGSSLPITCR